MTAALLLNLQTDAETEGINTFLFYRMRHRDTHALLKYRSNPSCRLGVIILAISLRHTHALQTLPFTGIISLILENKIVCCHSTYCCYSERYLISEFSTSFFPNYTRLNPESVIV